MDKIRCSHCRGNKKVPKLGGMIGECNLCGGTGQIDCIDKVVPIVADSMPMTSEIIKATANAVAVETLPVVEPIKVDAKKAIYKRKTASK